MPYLIGVPFEWFEDDRMDGIDPTIVVNLDLGAVIVPQPTAVVDLTNDVEPPYRVLFERIVEKLNNETAIYRASGLFPAARIQVVLWELIGGMLAVTAGVTAPDPKLTLQTVADRFLKVKMPLDERSYRRNMLNGDVVNFVHGLHSGAERLAGQPRFMSIFAGMQDIMAAVHKATK
jgi:hypothetical protein